MVTNFTNFTIRFEIIVIDIWHLSLAVRSSNFLISNFLFRPTWIKERRLFGDSCFTDKRTQSSENKREIFWRSSMNDVTNFRGSNTCVLRCDVIYGRPIKEKDIQVKTTSTLFKSVIFEWSNKFSYIQIDSGCNPIK